MIGAAIVVFAGMWRRNRSSEEPHTRRSWWPVLLVPALLVVAAPLFYMQFGVHRSMSYAPLHAPPQPPVPLVHYSRDEAVMPQKAAQLEAELHRQIAEMDIHELMDLFDAPRIVITMPRKITLPILSNLPKPISLPVKSVTILLAAAESAEDSNSLAGDDQQGDAELVEGQSDNRLIAEADAATETVAEEAEDAWSDSSKSGAKSEHVAEVKSSNAEVESIKEAERKRENNDEAELSTPIAASPQPKIEQPPPPKWISSPPLRIDEVRREVFVTDEWYTEQECERARDIGLMHKIYERIQWLNGDSYGDEFVDNVRLLEAAGDDQNIRDLQSAGITVPFIHQEIIKDQYFATVERSFAPMKKLYTLIEFNPNIDRQLRQYWDSHQRKERFAVVGAGASGILGLLGLCYGLLKVDTWTKGYYTKRLFLGVPAAIIGAGTLLAAMIFG
jgi:hypothetical protein